MRIQPFLTSIFPAGDAAGQAQFSLLRSARICRLLPSAASAALRMEPARGYHAGLAQVSQMPRDFGLALPKNLDKVADADLAASHQVQQAQAGSVSQGRKKAGQARGFGAASHEFIIYGLTNIMSNYIFA
jgi:hypothetical protein